MADIKHEDEDKKLNEYLNNLYDVNQLSDDEIKTWNEAYCYKGFDRKKALIDLMKKVPDIKIAQQMIMICGLIGPQRAANMKLINGKTISSYGIPASGLKGSSGMSCQRITACTADFCAFLLKRVDFPKRIPSISCPGWLQFPSAGSIRMTEDLRSQHIEFSKRFSILIGGEFNEQIYSQMIANAYLDARLGLFDQAGPIVISGNKAKVKA